MGSVRGIGIAAAVALVLAGCGAQSLSGVHAGPSPTTTTPATDRPTVRGDLFEQPWSLDDGALRVDPVASESSPHTRAEAMQAMRSAQHEFYVQSTGGRSMGTIEDMGAGYGLVTLAAKISTDVDETGATLPEMPSPTGYQERPAWLVWFRVTGAIWNCQKLTGAQPPIPDSVRAHAGWHVFVYPDRLDTAVSYLETYPWNCGGVRGGTATVALQHRGVPWRLVAHSGDKSTLAYDLPPCGHLTQAGGSGGPDMPITIVVAVPFGPQDCPTTAEQTITFDFPDDPQLVPGDTGLLTGGQP